MFEDNLYSTKIYEMNEIESFIYDSMLDIEIVKNNKKITYYNVPCSFDIETSSFMQQGEKCATMYIWQFGLNGNVLIGRTWEEFILLCDNLVKLLDLKLDLRLVCFIHNAAYEFQWIRHYFKWENVFSMDVRKPLYALTTSGIEFRCSYLLSGYALATLGKNLVKYPVQKKIGDLDYSLVRHCTTPLTQQELGYCINDVKVVMSYIQEQIELNVDITNLPLTKTGYVRKYCRDKCFKDNGKKSYKAKKYHKIMHGLSINSPKEYKMMKRAFQGGFTHASVFFSGKVVNEVSSYDFTSSYPAVMVAERYPMSRGHFVNIKNREDFKKNLDLYCCIFDVHFTGLKPLIVYENYLSISHCYKVEKPIVNNGRVVSADELYTTITDIDFKIIKKCYTWDSIEIGSFVRYNRGYLPTDLVKSILDLYKDKTELKGVEGMEVEYMVSKGMLNSVYGCTVTSIVRPEINYNNDWLTPTEPDYEEEIDKYNDSWSRFLFYPWGVFVCAYARLNVWSGILEFGGTGDYVYCDTDSVKVLNRERHIDYIENYNNNVIEKLKAACNFHGLEYDMIAPKTIKGVEKPLGVWDYEGTYDRFKTLGAKRYMVEEEGKINITVSGLNKKVCVPFLLSEFGDHVFDAFNDELYVPAEFTGKNTHTYIDEETEGIVIDYLGNENTWHELSSIHMEGCDYSMSIARTYADYIKQVQMEMY